MTSKFLGSTQVHPSALTVVTATPLHPLPIAKEGNQRSNKWNEVISRKYNLSVEGPHSDNLLGDPTAPNEKVYGRYMADENILNLDKFVMVITKAFMFLKFVAIHLAYDRKNSEILTRQNH